MAPRGGWRSLSALSQGEARTAHGLPRLVRVARVAVTFARVRRKGAPAQEEDDDHTGQGDGRVHEESCRMTMTSLIVDISNEMKYLQINYH